MTNIAVFLSRCGLFRGFDDARLDTLTRAADEVRFTNREEILREGDTGDAMFVVLAGAVQVYTRDHSGREVVLARLEAGEHFGEQALLPGGAGRRNASVRAAEGAHLARVPKSAFQAALADDDALRERLVEIGLEQISNNLQQLSALARGIGLHTAASIKRALAVGDILFRQGDEADALYFVSEGRLGIYRAQTLIGYVERGGCVGELALVRKELRSATVVAEQHSNVIAVPRAAFDVAYGHSATVREHIATLQRAYEFPQRGIVTQHAGTFAGHECITTLYHLLDGRVFAAYRVLGQSLYAIERLGGIPAETVTWQNDRQSRELRVDADGTLMGLTSAGEWRDVQTFHLFVLDGRRIGSAEREEFSRSGSFDAVTAVAADVVCHCVHVTTERLRLAMRNGAATFTQLQQATGCGTVCGGCIPVVAEMLGAEEWLLADVVEERDEAPGIRSFELVPRFAAGETAYPDAKPGQHVVVEGIVSGLRLRRPYTLSSAGAHGGRLCITVKREENGAFSPWLFDRRKKDEPLRITRPRGGYVIDLNREPVVCLVAGIGVTPAIAVVRTVIATAAERAPLYIHYSGRARDQMAFIRELESARNSQIEIVVKETSRAGHIDLPEISAIAQRFPNADWYLCGPQPYLDHVARLARSVGVSDARIHVETFTPVGTPGSTPEERAASAQFLLVPPRPGKEPLPIKILRGAGKALVAVANSSWTNWRVGPAQLNPLRWLEERLARAARLDPALPVEHLAIVSVLSWGAFQYQIKFFDRLSELRDANLKRALAARAEGRPLPADTPDANTFSYWIPGAPFPKFPKGCAVDTGWTSPGSGKVLPVIVTRSRTACDHLLRNADNTDRGPIPYHFFQQMMGRMDVPSCPGRKAAGIFGGQYHDNELWSEDRHLIVDMLSFPVIDDFSPTMAAAADEAGAIIDDALARDPDVVIDLNVLMSKMAYTIIVRGVFGNVDLAEMHALGRRLSDSVRQLLDFVFQFSMGRQSVPVEYVEAMNTGKACGRRIVDLLRDLDRQGKLTEVQRKAPTVRRVLEADGESDGGYDRLSVLLVPVIIAGHETTGHTMSWGFYEMARDPDLEKAVLEEIESFRAAHQGRALTTADYDERPLSWALLAECLRRHSPVQATPRTTLASGTVPPDPETGIGGFSYSGGAMVVFSVGAIHVDPERWPDPYAFRVDRWFEGIHDGMSLKERGRTVRANIRLREQAFDWLPFSDGPARCPGQHFNAHEFMLVLDALLPRYRFELINRDVPHGESMVVGPAPGKMGVRIRPRKKMISSRLEGF